MCRRHDFDVIVWTLRRVDFEINALTPELIGIGSNHSNRIHFEPWECQKYDRSDAPIRGLREKMALCVENPPACGMWAQGPEIKDIE